MAEYHTNIYVYTSFYFVNNSSDNMVSSAQFSIFNSDGDTPKLREQLCDDNRYVINAGANLIHDADGNVTGASPYTVYGYTSDETEIKYQDSNARINEAMLNGLYDIVFHGDITMAQSTGANFFTTVTGIAFTFAMSLMVLKFLKKGFDIYVLWTDGDPDADPMLLLINFVRAVATALIFRWVYDIFVDACSVVTNTILTSIGAETNYTATLVTGLSSLGVVPVIACLIFFIFYRQF